MRILFLTEDFSGASLCVRLAQEGNEVIAHVRNKEYSQILSGWIDRVPTIEAGLKWVGNAGLVVCDDTGFGALQDRLRSEGISVVGGSLGGDHLECDRGYCQTVLSECGIRPLETYDFSNAADAICFIKKHPRAWVLKHNGHAPKTSCYVGQMFDGSDVLGVLNALPPCGCSNESISTGIILQPRVDGQEIAVARYFNGCQWVGPIEFSIEHKRLFPGNLGPNTAEMGNLMWLDGNESHPFFSATLARLTPWLRINGYRGVIDINFIVNRDGIHPLEVTSRFGYPATQLRMELHESLWGEFLKGVADGVDYPLRWRSGVGIAVLLAAPPFPFSTGPDIRGASAKGMPIHFRQPLSDQDRLHLHFESILLHHENDTLRYVVADDSGYILHATGHGHTIDEARNKAYALIQNIVVPSMYYREDIGSEVNLEDIESTLLSAVENTYGCITN